MWEAWQALENRWLIVSGLQGDKPQGLDATQVESTLRLMGMKRGKRSRVFAGLRTMEQAALAALYGNGDT